MVDSAQCFEPGGVAAYEELRSAQHQQMKRMLPAAVDRLEWSAQRLRAFRQRRLRALLDHARRHSSWHATRLAGVDLDDFGEADLARLPTMNRQDVTTHWDAIVTDRALNLQRCEQHVRELGATPAYLLARYNVLASSGTTGRSALFPYDWDEWVQFYVAYARWLPRGIGLRQIQLPRAPVIASVAHDSAAHGTVALSRTFSEPGTPVDSFPSSLAFGQIVEGLRRRKPDLLFGYPSMIERLARETLAGRLPIAPKWVSSTAETLLPHVVELVSRAWSVPVVNNYGASDVGIVACGCGLSSGLHLTDDLAVIELLNEDGAPARTGERATPYVTALTHRTLPMIRYALDDQVTLLEEPCPCGSSFRKIADVVGRTDECFRYASGVMVHPEMLRKHFSGLVGVEDYRFRQTETGLDIEVQAQIELPAADIQTRLCSLLAELGLESPTVRLSVVSELARQGGGKVRRFVGVES